MTDHSPDRDIKEDVRRIVLDAGASRVAFAAVADVADEDCNLIDKWIAAGHHAGMAYMERHTDIRRNPRMLLSDARTMVCCAFDYRQSKRHPLFADYALGRDYHDVIRQRLGYAADEIMDKYGGETRVCVDTAPLRERYWALVSGLGFVGLNGQIFVDGIGSKVFLAEILWTGTVEPDTPSIARKCKECGACVKACPGQALDGCGGVDASRCLSYLTIEHRGELPEDLRLPGRIYGCDVCQDVCPLNRVADSAVTSIPEFVPTDTLMSLTADEIIDMEPQGFRDMFRYSAVKRAKLDGLRRNALRHHDF